MACGIDLYPRSETDETGLSSSENSDPTLTVEDLLVGRILWNRFDVVERLGQGGMGAVYRCRDRDLHGRDVAVKILLPHLLRNDEARRRLVTEVATAAGLGHPNIVSVFDFHKDRARVGFSMELLGGHNLEEHLTGSAPDSPLGGTATADRLPLVLAIAHQLAEALEYLHHPARGLVHRDIKPSNVMLCGDPTPESVSVKLLDFGVVHALDTGETNLASQPGTLAYMAPELQSGQELPSPQSDVFSYGVVLYRALTGALPSYKIEPPSELVPGLPAEIDAPICSCLASISNRPSSVAEVVTAIRGATTASPGPGQPPPGTVSLAPVPPPRPSRAGRFLTLGCSCGVVGWGIALGICAYKAQWGFLGTLVLACILVALASGLMFRQSPLWGLLLGSALWAGACVGSYIHWGSMSGDEIVYYALAAGITGVVTACSMVGTRFIVDLVFPPRRPRKR